MMIISKIQFISQKRLKSQIHSYETGKRQNNVNSEFTIPQNLVWYKPNSPLLIKSNDQSIVVLLDIYEYSELKIYFLH